jgi:hypothetical protein
MRVLLTTKDLHRIFIGEMSKPGKYGISFIQSKLDYIDPDAEKIYTNCTLKMFIRELVFMQDVYVMMFQKSHFNIYTEEQKGMLTTIIPKITAFEYLISAKITTVYVTYPILNKLLKKVNKELFELIDSKQTS